ncbi:MAG: hypothetical protein ABSG19_11960 [Candidatus Aminicenantales bacterium]
MKKRIFFRTFILMVLSGGIIAAGRARVSVMSPGRAQEERPKFYATRVISEQGVVNSREALGEPDGRYAEIAPGGQMVLLMESKIYPSTTFDDGIVFVKEQADYGLEGWFPESGSKKDPGFAWMPLIKGQSSGGFRVAYVDALAGNAGVNMIRISNNDTKPILVDAVAGYGR